MWCSIKCLLQTLFNLEKTTKVHYLSLYTFNVKYYYLLYAGFAFHLQFYNWDTITIMKNLWVCAWESAADSRREKKSESASDNK